VRGRDCAVSEAKVKTGAGSENGVAWRQISLAVLSCYRIHSLSPKDFPLARESTFGYKLAVPSRLCRISHASLRGGTKPCASLWQAGGLKTSNHAKKLACDLQKACVSRPAPLGILILSLI
jgi:hypothetical protein